MMRICSVTYLIATVTNYDLKIKRDLGKQQRSDGRFWPVDLCGADVRHRSANLRLVSMRSETILPQ
jgi:hypothetical protein